MRADRTKTILAVDTHHLLLEHAGTKRVTLNLLEQFRKSPQITLIELQPAFSFLAKKGKVSKFINHFLRFFWVHICLPVMCSYKQVDVLLSPEFNTPLFTLCKRVVIAHDAHIRSQKEYISPLWFYCYYIPFIEKAIRSADIIFTISEFAKKQIVELMCLDTSKVWVAYNGIDPLFTEPVQKQFELSQTLQQQFKNQSYILFVGTFEARKNIERLLQAFSILKKKHQTNIKLAIVGQAATGKHSDRSIQIQSLIIALNLTDDVILCGYISDEELPSIYRGATIIAFPSLHEGFGLPIIEGFATGIPVLTSKICAMPEIAADAALLVNPYEVEDIADKLEILIFDVQLREQLILKGKQRIQKFTWENCSALYIRHIVLLKKG